MHSNHVQNLILELLVECPNLITGKILRYLEGQIEGIEFKNVKELLELMELNNLVRSKPHSNTRKWNRVKNLRQV